MSWAGGDWMCGACCHQNFKKREACQRCGYPKHGGADIAAYMYARTEVLAGDWYCVCGAHNYASRPTCYRCAALKLHANHAYFTQPNAPPGWKNGDWICPRIGCGVHNYACRNECFKCRTMRG